MKCLIALQVVYNIRENKENASHRSILSTCSFKTNERPQNKRETIKKCKLQTERKTVERDGMGYVSSCSKMKNYMRNEK